MFNHETFLSPFTWRYGSPQMRALWSEVHKRRLWRRIWLALAEVQHRIGLVSAEQLADLRAHVEDVNLERADAIEAEIQHDLMAEIKCYAEQCPIGGAIIHLGATSADIEDNADVLRLRESLSLILAQLRDLLRAFAERIAQSADLPTIAFTHLQPAEPTTVGYRLACYAYDLCADYESLRALRAQLRGKGFKGAVGTSAAYAQLLEGTALTPQAFERQVMQQLGLEALPVATQIYSRRQDWLVVSALAGLALTLHKIAFDMRLLQSPPLGEWQEPFGAAQVGSSAMPFKRNPINAENIDSLARFVSALPIVAWQNAANSLLERTLDDSANRRSVLPEIFLATDEMLRRMTRLVRHLQLDHDAIRRNLAHYGAFAATERVLMEAVRNGGDRQVLHELIREHSLSAWRDLRERGTQTLQESLCADPRLTAFIAPERLRQLMRAEDYLGDAPQRARAIVRIIYALTDEE
ncbi:MAG: adenylosuccinate lyase [Candidatus Thermofonsia Clade 1 bacterium]|jgi:adenylosuccinate lyase|uniref:Adenylosuccinate lyase n=1 Tax=Candidatus Thermofonsia Clade 1 bacterium TaxID=2364210 RepID=A0A2M8PGR0_9CHLR|nr:MAG: adenylosuccinate lyase [Candidatus Thermofonsia Clade 1 bacterium]RMF52273.1 MAG: adenylosuccinate lyase [Chloroflexota bacterium]